MCVCVCVCVCVGGGGGGGGGGSRQETGELHVSTTWLNYYFVYSPDHISQQHSGLWSTMQTMIAQL